MTDVGHPSLILGVGMVSAVGLSAAATAAAVRAGIAGFATADLVDESFEPVQVARPAYPTELQGDPDGIAVNGRARRLEWLLNTAMADLLDLNPTAGRLTVVLALADPPAQPSAEEVARLVAAVRRRLGPVDVRTPCSDSGRGRAGGLIAMQIAASLLQEGGTDYVVVGGVDEQTSPTIMAAHLTQRRLLTRWTRDGRICGAGAAFVLLGRATMDGVEKWQGRPLAILQGAAGASGGPEDQVDRPNISVELVERLLRYSHQRQAIRKIMVGLTGEQALAKELAIPRMRSAEFLPSEADVEHPADCLGDVGAAFGPMLVGLAATGLAKGYVRGAVLIWSPSDNGSRAVALIGPVEG